MDEIKLKHLPDLEVKLSEEVLKEDFKELVELLKPGWDWQKVEIKSLQGGYMNNMTHVYMPSELPNDGLVFRIFGGFKVEDLEGLLNRNKEIAGLQAAYNVGCGAPVYAVFKNGMVLGFLEGRNLTMEDFANPEINRLFARSIALIHSIDPSDLTAPNGEPIVFDKEEDMEKFSSKGRKAILNMPETMPNPDDDKRVKENLASWKEIIKEYDFIVGFIKSLDLPVTFNHGDTHIRNTIYNPKEEKVYLVDFEMMGYNYEMKDVGTMLMAAPAWHFFETESDQNIQARAGSDENAISFFRSYLEAKYELQGKPASMVTDDDVMEMKLVFDIYSIAENVPMMGFGPMFALAEQNVDGISLAILCKKDYAAQKEKMLELGKQFRELRKNKVT